MAVNNFLTDCPDCDEVFVFPATDEDQDCSTYDLDLSQVSDIIIQPDGAPVPFAAWSTTPTLVSGAIDNTATDNTKCRHLVGIASVSAPEGTVQELPKGKTRIAKETSTLLFETSNLSALQWAFFQKLACGPTGFKMWFADIGKKIYGSATGLSVASVAVRSPSPGGKEDIKKIFLEIKIDHKGLFDRRVSPLA